MFSSFMVPAWEAGTLVALAAGVVGFFVVLRGASFAAHALPVGAFAGAAGATLLGISTLLGFGACSLLGALAIAALGRRGRTDVGTALVIAFLLGLGSLFLSRTTGYAPALYTLLFGQVLGVGANEVVPTGLLAGACVALVALLFRPLLFSTVLPDAATTQGWSAPWLEAGFLLVLALVTTTAVPVVGSLLVFSLLVSPAAAARAVTTSPVAAMATSTVLALALVWGSLALSYATNLPVGFFVGVGGSLAFVAGRLVAIRRRAERQAVVATA
jgi:zinc/manganese transport system permease protein